MFFYDLASILLRIVIVSFWYDIFFRCLHATLFVGGQFNEQNIFDNEQEIKLWLSIYYKNYMYYSHYNNIKYIGFEPFLHAINQNIVSFFMIFNRV